MKLRRKHLALGLAAAALAAAAGVAGGPAVAEAATASPSVTVPSITATTDSSVSLSWTLSNGAVKADIQIYPVGLGFQVFRQVIAGTSVTATGLDDDTAYYVRASAIDASGKGYGWTAANMFFTRSSFGVGQVFVNNGNGYSALATYSAALEGGNPGDVTSGAFRFTCRDYADGCDIQLRAYATAPGYALYPRILIFQQVGANINSDPETYNEYGEGADNNGATVPLTTTSAAVPVGYGTAFTSGGNNPGSPNGAKVLNVPGLSGLGARYDVITTWTFSKS